MYNSALTVIESIDSVIYECTSNPYQWELILVDDGSNDNSVELVNEYILESKYKGNIIFLCQENRGAASARNAGLRIAKGEYITFNDSDDRWLPNKLNLQMKYMLSNMEVDMLGCCYGNDNFQKGSLTKLDYITKISIQSQILKNYFSPPTVIFKAKSLCKSGFFNEELRYAEEGFFFNNIVFFYNCFYMQHTVAGPILNKKRWGDSGLSGNIIEMEKGELFNIKSAYKFGYISFIFYAFAICFSIAKFLRRLIISKYIKLCK